MISRSKSQVSVQDVRDILKRAGYTGIVRSQFQGMDEEALCRFHGQLIRELLQRTPRLNAPTLQNAVLEEYGKGADCKVNKDFAEAIHDAFRFVHLKKKNVTSGTRTTEFMKGFLKAVWPPPEEELVPIVDLSSSSCSATPLAALMDAEPSAPSSSSCSALVPFASPSKVAKQDGDMSPGSVLALYGIDRSQARTLTRNVSDSALSINTISDDSQLAEATASDAVSTIHQVRVWYGSPHSISPHGFQNRN